MIKKFIFSLLLVSFALQIGARETQSILPGGCISNPPIEHPQILMQPVIKDGLYYYSLDDNHEHMGSVLSFIRKKILSPTNLIKSITSLFHASNKNGLDPKKLLNPTQTKPAEESIEPIITWIGHASYLVQINGFNILTDPIFGNVKAGPITITKRAFDPGIELKDLPPIDAIVISHNHSDHTDTYSLMALAQKYDPIVFVPEGNKELFESFGFSKVVENTWWDKQELSKNGKTVTITCVPAYHWSIRFALSSYRKSLWSGWMVQANDKSIYFAGDTAYGPHFKQIQSQFPSIDIALMPIGPTHRGENLHKHSHVDALEAVDAFLDLDAKTFIPMHFGTFFLSEDTLTNPIRRLYAYWAQKKELAGKKLAFLRPGQEFKA